jgi:hypothetical protein
MLPFVRVTEKASLNKLEVWFWSCRWVEATSMNCGHKGPVVHPTGDVWTWRTTVEWYRQGKTGSFTRALWQYYQQSRLVANQEELGEENYEFSLWSIFVLTSKWFLRVVNSHDKWPMALLPLRKKVCWTFLFLNFVPALTNIYIISILFFNFSDGMSFCRS